MNKSCNYSKVVKKHILNNVASEEYLQTIRKHCIDYQKVPINMYRRNAAEKAIGMFKNHFKSILAGVDRTFPMHSWDWLLPQAESTLNIMQQTNIAPTVLAYAYMYRQHIYNKMLMAPMECAALIHLKPNTRKTWDSNTTDGYFLGPSGKHYCCFEVWIKQTQTQST